MAHLRVPRAVVLPPLILSILVCPLQGCFTTTVARRGKSLRTESKAEKVRTEYQLVTAEEITIGKPVVVVKVEHRDWQKISEREIFQTIVESTKRTLSFEPRFFLWPVNLVRTPIGVVGCIWGVTITGVHTVSAVAVGTATGLAPGVGLIVGSAFSIWFLGPVAVMGMVLGGFMVIGVMAAVVGQKDNDASKFGRFFPSAGMAIVELALAPVELPQLIWCDQPGFPFTRRTFDTESTALSRYWSSSGTFIGAFWNFAWDYEAYPFIVMPARKVSSRIGDREMTGDWQDKGEQPTEYKPVAGQEFIVKARGKETRITADVAGDAYVRVLELAEGLRYDERLSLIVRAEVDGREIGRQDFTYDVSKLRAPFQPTIKTDPADGKSVTAPRLRLTVTVTGDRKLKDVSVSLNGQPLKGWKAIDRIEFTGTADMLLRPGANKVTVEATDEGDLKTTRDVDIELE